MSLSMCKGPACVFVVHYGIPHGTSVLPILTAIAQLPAAAECGLRCCSSVLGPYRSVPVLCSSAATEPLLQVE